MMNLEKVERLFKQVWGDREGFVFLPWIDRAEITQTGKGFHNGPAFSWPDELPKILDHIEAHTEHEQYWVPVLFSDEYRSEDVALPGHVLFGDLDEADPRKLPHDVPRPTFAWESSPKRYQAVWVLDEVVTGAYRAGGLNQRLTYCIGSDRSGWDITQLLRIPGSYNYKPERIEEFGTAPRGRWLWSKGKTYSPEAFNALPQIETFQAHAEVDVDWANLPDPLEVVAKLKAKRLHEWVAKTRPGVGGGNNSIDRLNLARDMVRQGGWAIEQYAAIVLEYFQGRCKDIEKDIVRCWAKAEGQIEIEATHTEADPYADRLASVPEHLREAVKAKLHYLEVDRWVKQLSINRPLPQLLSMSELFDYPEPDWLIDGLLMQGTNAIMFGPGGASKSFIALDMALSVATGKPWHSKKVKRGKVLQIVAEGQSYWKYRVKGWLDHHGERYDERFYTPSNGAYDLTDQRHIEALVRQIEERDIDLLIIDTWRKCTPGVEENDNTMVASIVADLLRLRQVKPQVTTLTVHHTGHTVEGKEVRERGASAFRDEFETRISCINKGPEVHVQVVKQKDGPDWDEPLRLIYDVVDARVGSHVKKTRVFKDDVITMDQVAKLGDYPTPLNERQKALLDFLRDQVEALGINAIQRERGGSKEVIKADLIVLMDHDEVKPTKDKNPRWYYKHTALERQSEREEAQLLKEAM